MTTMDGLGIDEVIAGEAAQTHMVEDVLEGTDVATEIPKSPRTPRPKKDKQEMVPIRMSLRNLWHKLSMEEKGKAVTTVTDEEEEYLQALTTATEEEEDVEEDIQLLCFATKLSVYVPPRKGKTKVPTNLDETKSSL